MVDALATAQTIVSKKVRQIHTSKLSHREHIEMRKTFMFSGILASAIDSVLNVMKQA